MVRRHTRQPEKTGPTPLGKRPSLPIQRSAETRKRAEEAAEAEEAADQADVEEGDREFDLDGTASPASMDLDFFKTCSPDLPSLPNVAIAERKVGLEGGSELAYRGITAESW